MKSIKYLILILLITGICAGCLSEEEVAKARKYKLDYVYIEDQLELKETPYTKTFKFKARSTIEKPRFTVGLVYFNFKTLYSKADEENLMNICNSLIGFSYVVYDRTHNKLTFSSEVKDINKDLSVSAALPLIFLDSDMQIEKNVNYEVVVNIPGEKDINEQYLKPVLIVGVLQKPSF